MTDAAKRALNAFVDRVLAYRPATSAARAPAKVVPLHTVPSQTPVSSRPEREQFEWVKEAVLRALQGEPFCECHPEAPFDCPDQAWSPDSMPEVRRTLQSHSE